MSTKREKMLAELEGILAKDKKEFEDLTESLGPKHSDTLQARTEYVNDLCRRGPVEEILPFLKETLALHLEVFGANSERTARIQDRIALVYFDLRKQAEGFEYAQAAYATCRQLDSTHGLRWQTSARLGLYMHDFERNAEAYPLLAEAFQNYQQFGDLSDRFVILALGYFHLVTYELGRYEELIAVNELLINHFETHGEQVEGFLLSILLTHGYANYCLKNFKESQKYYVKALSNFAHQYDPFDEDILGSRSILGAAYFYGGNFEKAVLELQEIEVIWLTIHDDRHLRIVHDRLAIANSLCELERFSEAIPYLEKARDGFREANPELAEELDQRVHNIHEFLARKN